MDHAEQLQHVKEHPAWTRLAGIILLVPTEMDQRGQIDQNLPNAVKAAERTNRLIHTEHVISIAGRIADNLRLNRPLTELIAATHDIGHLPYGHHAEYLLGEVIFPKAGLRVKHNENGPILYTSIVGAKNVDPDVLCGIREHRSVDGVHSSLESWAVAYADEFATLVSNVRDGLTIPSGDDSTFIVMQTVAARVSGTRLERKPLDKWCDELVDELYLEQNAKNCRIRGRDTLNQLIGRIREIDNGWDKHPWIKASELHIENRFRLCFAEKWKHEAMNPEAVVNWLLTATEHDMAQFARHASIYPNRAKEESPEVSDGGSPTNII